MNKLERVKAALSAQEVDRAPISVWMHYPAVDQDPRALAEKQVNFQETYDLDFIKLMPFGLYSVQDWGCQIKFFCTETEPPIVDRYGIQEVQDWAKLQVLPPTFGTLGKQLLLTKYVKELVQPDVPFIQTIFSPLTTARKLAGDRIFQDLREQPKIFHKAMEVITKTTVDFVKANIAAGASGIFFATQCASYDVLTSTEHNEFGRYYDLAVLEAANCGGWFNVLHIHGANTMFKEMVDYPVQALNWHDRHEYPTMKQARELTGKCFIGGLDEIGAVSQGKPEQVTSEVFDAIQAMDSKGLMLGPGCVAAPDTPEQNIYAARLATQRYAAVQSKNKDDVA